MMKRIAEGATRIFLACGTTDFRKQIPGLVAAVTLSFKLDPYNGDYVFIFCNRKRDSIQAAFFFYFRSRGGENARKLLKDFNGYLITDAYAGYDTVPDIKRALCWSHARRYLIESIPLDSKGKEIPGSKDAEGREYINLLFKVEGEIKNLP